MIHRFASVLAFAAAGTLALPSQATALPVRAAAVPDHATAPAWSPADEIAEHRRYRRHRHRDRGIDAGDVIAGVAIIGGIAAIASAVGNRDRDRARYEPRYDRRSSEPSGLDRAGAICRDEIERSARVEAIDAVRRTAAGWTVQGRLFDGSGFTCTLGNHGRVDAIRYGEAGLVGIDRQYSSARYAAAWDRVGQGYASPDDAVPAYPGGLVPGATYADDYGDDHEDGYGDDWSSR